MSATKVSLEFHLRSGEEGGGERASHERASVREIAPAALRCRPERQGETRVHASTAVVSPRRTLLQAPESSEGRNAGARAKDVAIQGAAGREGSRGSSAISGIGGDMQFRLAPLAMISCSRREAMQEKVRS